LNNSVTFKSGLEVTQGHSKWYHSKAWVRFPICLPQFRDKAGYWSQIMICLYPLAFTAPVRGGGSPSQYCHPVWCGKTRMVGLPDGLHKIPACDGRTDRQTGRQTDGRTDILPRHSPRYAYASRGKNLKSTYRRVYKR